MNLQKILEKFSIISNTELDDISSWIPFCEDSMEEIKAHLKKDVDIEEPSNARRLETAAATLTLYKYILYNITSNINTETFAAGELRVKTNYTASIKSAYQAWEQAKNSISDILIDETFTFERIVY